MEIFRKPSFADSTGDAIPFYHDGIYHIFSLTPPTGTTVYPERLRTTWSHTVSKDLIHWEELETALYPESERTRTRMESGRVPLSMEKESIIFIIQDIIITLIPNRQSVMR